MACQSNTSGYCERSQSGSQVHELAQGDTLEDGGWHSRVWFFTSDFGITFQRGSGLELVAYAVADYVSKATDRRSFSGGAVMYAGA